MCQSDNVIDIVCVFGNHFVRGASGPIHRYLPVVHIRVIWQDDLDAVKWLFLEIAVLLSPA